MVMVLWAAQVVLSVGAALIALVLLATIAGAPITALISLDVIALIIITCGALMRSKAPGAQPESSD